MGEHSEHEGIHLSTATLVTVIMVMIYITSTPFLRKIRFIQSSGITMLIAIILTLFAKQFFSSSNFFKGFQFNDVFFFTFILPLIIFSAGYNLRRDLFFKNIRYILAFSLSGTFINFFITALLTYSADKHDLFYFTTITEHYNNTEVIHDIFNNETNVNITTPIITKTKTVINFSLWDILLFSAALSASDTTTSAELFNEDSEAKLHSIASGDAVFTDALCIALFKIISHYTSQNPNTPFTSAIAWDMFANSITLFIFSFIMGIIFGGLSSSFLKKMKIYHLNRVQEISILLLFAFMCYTLCDWIHLSPIISLLSCGIFMSHYTFYNLCYQSREESTSISRILEILASAFAFSFLGLTTVYFTTQALSIGFIIFELFATIIGRFCAVFVQLWIFKLFCIDDFKLKTSKKIVLTLTGTIKGAVSFALALSIHSSNEKNREVLISSMIIIVLITTVVFGGIMPYLKRSVKTIDYNSPQGSPESSSYVQGEHSINEEESLYTYIHPNFKGDNKNKMEKKSLDELKTQVSYWLSHYWVEFDDVCIKPKLVHNWPEVKEDNDNITKLIKLALHKYKVKKLPTTIETDSLLLKTPEIGRRSGGNSIEMNLMSSSQIRLDKSIKEDNDKKIELPELNEKLLFHSESEKSHDNK